MMGGGEGLVVGGERWEASVLVYWCACVFFFYLLTRLGLSTR